MRNSLLVLKAEIIKQHHNSFHSYFIYFSLLIWPILGFFTVYFTYKPFSLEESTVLDISNSRDLMIFLSTGYMAYTCFWSMIQNAWQLGWLERQSGTLEIAFLSPANRLMMLYGKALGALLQDTWMFLCFCLFILFYGGALNFMSLFQIPLIFLILIVSSTIWGGMMNAFFLFSRDATVLMNIFDDPMVLFSGVRVPTNNFPYWAKMISFIFPLTYCLNIIRAIFSQEGSYIWLSDLAKLVVCLAIMIVITVLAVKKAEKINKNSGEFGLF